jgi:hypothetical protein
MGWHRYYTRLFNRTMRETAAHMALWYYALMLADDEVRA